ncbi:nSTAND1 domain-containing NTPase [Calothrix sp. NIES-2098]|uniref:WD40 domain-containing protein n=1 Tax=Calothrix sp. NIES-2098 TaxID=1954171 RepID=UPI000B5F46AE|nr:WD-repeat protein [Calothrix sp. NIES-2098]
MSNQHELENLAAENELSLQTLVRAITLSQGEFSLILLRCNYAAFRQDIVQRLHQLSPVKIREITLPVSVKTLYTSIYEKLGDEQPSALIVFGLESVKDIDTILTSANRVREEFRKNFPFPVLLLINDQVLQKLIRLATDFENWATIIHFAIATPDLVQFIKQTSEEVFAKVLDAGAGKFLDNSALNLEIGSPQRVELELAQAELQKRGVELDAELEASLEFVLGRDAVSMEQSRQHYERSLALARQSFNLEQEGCVLHNLGLWWRTYAIQHLAEQEAACLHAKDYYHKCLELFERANRPDLVAKFINTLGEVLQTLQQWDELEKVAQKALSLYQIYPDWFREARAYGFLAEVALADSAWNKAKQAAEKALSIVAINQSTQPNANLELVRYYHQGWYLFALARALQQLNKVQDALATLKAARRETKPQYDPELYIRILERLHNIYYQQGQYLAAFHIKQEKIQIEHQYGFRAFIGAAYLIPQHEVINPALFQAEKLVKVAQEIAVSGRQQDVNRLMNRMSRNDHKLTVFHGQSGVGKSSILNGGLVPALQLKSIDARDVLPIVIRVYTDWMGILAKCLVDNDTSSNSIEFICETLQNNTERNLLTVLIFDQFEEFFFVYTDQSKRQPFYKFLRLVLDIPFVKVILCLREDYLHYLLECDRLLNFTTINNNILDKNVRYYLGNFSSVDAKAVVQSLIEQTHFHLEPALIDKLVEDLADELGEVRPIELQIVGAQLQTDKITTLDQYLQLGTKEKLVERFLEEVIKDCGSENELCARVVLYLLTDDKGTRPFKTADNLAEDLKTADIVPEKEQLNLVLEILVGSGLVLKIPEDPADLYQLVHDYLVSFIRQSQQVRELEERKKEKEIRQQVEAELNHVLERQRNNAKRQRNWAIAGSAMMTFLAIVSVIFAFQAEYQRKQSEKNRIIAISKTSEALFTSQQTFDAFFEGIHAGILLKKLPSAQSDSQLRTQVVAALQQSFYWIVERDRLEGHQALIWGVTFSHDGKLIASTSYDHTIKLWNLDGSLYKTLEGHKDKVLGVSFSPDDRIIVSGDFKGIIRFWRRDGTFLKEINTHSKGVDDDKGVYSIDFSPDGQTIATGSRDGTLKLWKQDGTPLKTLKAHEYGVNSLAFSPDGKMIATGGRDSTLKLWTYNGNLLHTIKGYEDFVWDVAWSTDSQTIAAAAGSDHKIKLWNRDGTLLKDFKAHKDGINSVAFSPDGKMIATASDDKTIKLWKPDGTLLTTLSGHTNGVYSVRFSPDCKTLVSASADSTMKLWQVGSMICSRNAKIPTAGADSKMKIQIGSGVVSTLNAHSDQVNKVHFLLGEKIIVSASNDKTVKLSKLDGTLNKTFEGNNVSFSPNGQTIVTANDDNTVNLWKHGGKFLRTLFQNSDQIFDLNFSPNGKFIALGSRDNKVIILQPDSKKYQVLNKHHDWVKAVAWSPDSQMLASASDDNTVILWKQDNKGEFYRYETLTGDKGHNSWVLSVSFSPDGKMIATGSNDKTVILWRRDDKGKFSWDKKLIGHTGQVNGVSFSPKGDQIATASDDKTVKLWTHDGNLIKTLTGHSDRLLSAAFSDDGKTLALSSADGAIILWNLDELNHLNNLDSLLVRGCDWLHDYLKNNSTVNESDRHLCDDIKQKPSSQ